jgi:DNA (cytosine-5)-methyltransferase 1
MPAYYNEIDPFAAQWLRNLIKANQIAGGVVDERSIIEVKADELREFEQCHFFAGIGVWSYALRQAGWPDNRPVWTGSCPCQPFSPAGKGEGTEDERHLWPTWFELIEEFGPEQIFGEQVANGDGLAWLDIVQPDLEKTGYAFGAADLCSAGFGSPNIRQRLFFTACRLGDTECEGLERQPRHGQAEKMWQSQARPIAKAGFSSGELADSNSKRRRPKHQQQISEREGLGKQSRRDSRNIWLANSDSNGLNQEGQRATESGGNGAFRNSLTAEGKPATGPTNGPWANADWLFCQDGKWRPVEPGSTPLAAGTTSRVGLIRGYGNAINAEVAKQFIQAAMSVMP